MNLLNAKTVLLIVVITCGYAGVFGLSGYLERNRPSLPAEYMDEDLALQGANLKGYCLGFEGLIADWYWVKSLQYIGDKMISNEAQLNLDNLKDLNPRLLHPYLDNATTLDPNFIEAYSYGAVVLPAYDKEQAIRIAEKGVANNPKEWRLYQHLGYIHWKTHNYQKASEIYYAGAKIENAPAFLGLMAAKMKSEGGSRAVARQIYLQMFEQATDNQVKENAKLRLWQLDSLDEQDQIRQTLKNLQKDGKCGVVSFREILPLVAKIELPDNKSFRIDNSGNLIDPSGVAYILDAQNCDVHLDHTKTKIPPN